MSLAGSSYAGGLHVSEMTASFGEDLMHKNNDGFYGIKMTAITNKMLFILICVCCMVLFPLPSPAAVGIKNTKHNLSVSGPGPVLAISEQQVCKFCHTPHNASPSVALWNHVLTEEQNYINYWSPTLKSYPSQEAAPPVDGFSRLCLSCHDGTVALGSLINREEEIETVSGYSHRIDSRLSWNGPVGWTSHFNCF